jgi:hypothetical protein
LVVLRFDFTTKTSTLWVDPVTETGGFNAIDAAATLTGTFDKFGLRQASVTSAGDFFIDDLVVATTFAEVVPEPATLGVLGMSAGLMLARRRTRKV